MPPVDWLPTLIATVSAFVIGGIWYSPALFARTWQREASLSDEQIQTANKGKIYGIAFALCLLAAIAFSMVVGQNPTFWMAFHSGVGIGLFWVATSFGVNYLFEQKSLKLWLINAGYHTVQFTVYGLVFGLM